MVCLGQVTFLVNWVWPCNGYYRIREILWHKSIVLQGKSGNMFKMWWHFYTYIKFTFPSGFSAPPAPPPFWWLLHSPLLIKVTRAKRLGEAGRVNLQNCEYLWKISSDDKSIISSCSNLCFITFVRVKPWIWRRFFFGEWGVGDSHMKGAGMLVVSLWGENFGFWWKECF